ncbi:MAG TPA: family 10 glycosylhydrolase, partial [Candidatus Omnitrophota bacterium]|nr:family 10 glycosylhydrolase [Candidatus Omnitrophota bacterium]
MKKICLIIFLLILAAQAGAAPNEDSLKYGLLVTTLQEPPVLGSRSEIEKLVRFSKENHIDTIFIQIYRANRSYFPSSVGDSAPYKAYVKKVGEDPLVLLIKKAHESGIKVYAWINMMSLAENKNAVILKKYGTSILTCGPSEKKRVEDYETDKQYFMEPGDLRVRQELVDMTGEIVSSYVELDGLLFDYIRYPDMDPPYGYSASNVARFKKVYGRKHISEKDSDWKNWKRRQVTETLEAVAHKARSLNHDIEISATACAPYTR